ncbi:N-acetylglucosaminyl-diphospho-decaprenol L-rhamnosyltransferase [Roseimaritima multifibrata]|uniref:N-acetylglucosaminyl-diphospho-decaprenol L-rhamnosyltransferase n=1 Tax=Roseimaritima multifibrata TaxID=1930274 RepID=A0A517MMR7_9BACT|nr:glycosyltransferase family 2 protein [Roseimaritima multifibrata]QDS96077.1 N-acetylglucosaminyl-diphospho-decaprenol L-rhamnosyltransferase [Roseimaritima multifibrata]
MSTDFTGVYLPPKVDFKKQVPEKIRSVGVSIVNYRTAPLCIDAINSLFQVENEAPRLNIVVVDSDSNDGSAEQLYEETKKLAHDQPVTLIALKENVGFAASNNIAIKKLLEIDPTIDALWLLNPDTVVHTGALRALIEAMGDSDKIGIVGSRLEHRNGDPQRSAFRFPGILSEFERGAALAFFSRLLKHWQVAPEICNTAFETDWVAGASMLVRRDVFEKIGQFDEGYFLYYEETDLCLTAARAGFQSVYQPKSRVIHLVGSSSGVTSQNRDERRLPKYWFDSRQRYFTKNYGHIYSLLVDISWVTSLTISHLRSWALLRKPKGPKMVIRSVITHRMQPLFRKWRITKW